MVDYLYQGTFTVRLPWLNISQHSAGGSGEKLKPQLSLIEEEVIAHKPESSYRDTQRPTAGLMSSVQM